MRQRAVAARATRVVRLNGPVQYASAKNLSQLSIRGPSTINRPGANRLGPNRSTIAGGTQMQHRHGSCSDRRACHPRRRRSGAVGQLRWSPRGSASACHDIGPPAYTRGQISFYCRHAPRGRWDRIRAWCETPCPKLRNAGAGPPAGHERSRGNAREGSSMQDPVVEGTARASVDIHLNGVNVIQFFRMVNKVHIQL